MATTPTPLSDQLLTLSPLSTKVQTSLLALALSDALGGPAEFQPRGTFPHISTMQPNSNFNLPPGTWTDDTSMTLCLARAITSPSKPPTPADQAKLYLKWYRAGYLSAIGRCFDIGATTRAALHIWESAGNKADMAAVQQQVRENLGGRFQAGNGSLMRVLPVGLVYWRDLEVAVEVARATSEVTHPAGMCRDACAVYTLLVGSILGAVARGERMSKAQLLEVLYGYEFQDEELGAVLGRESGFLELPVESVKTSGYVLHTLEAALWVFFRTESFEEGVVKVVNMGDDADTVAAVYGGLAGVWYADALETEGSLFWTEGVRRWREELMQRKVVEDVAKALWKIQK
ncbi:uncharacterized protein H6S33_009675 [Morchella sextelata]|uniref:uncharacterized protein n=1 Tax=Morchella sextelata TaxID=1174677 RepID=UPI001D0408D1|nr:uncharacterized protein H6S33_009675 [Morchella sextelata]KAH0613295.1 hypothetical protein H6S33_009675 [Morchella sextelata]